MSIFQRFLVPQNVGVIKMITGQVVINQVVTESQLSGSGTLLRQASEGGDDQKEPGDHPASPGGCAMATRKSQPVKSR
jgi:hypothetical protein